MALLLAIALALSVIAIPAPASAIEPPAPFTITEALTGLTAPTAVRFAPDGRVFVAEKSGRVKVFDGLSDLTPTVVIDVRNDVHDFWDRGLLGLAVHPAFPSTPYVYLFYTLDKGNTWGDGCPTPPGPTTDGCMVDGRLSRFQVSPNNTQVGSETILIEGLWCQQFPSHSVGDLFFGQDGALYASAGEGASFNVVDYGQRGGGTGSPTPKNPCGDPPVPIGGNQSPPTAEGGALRSQDLLTSGDPVSLDGTIIRIDPITGAALPNNPLFGGSVSGDDRIIAYGLRNPFRITGRPGTNEIWVGDVGWNNWEEINRIPNPTDTVVENFGWPCYEGSSRQSGYDSANLNLCEGLYSGSINSAVRNPYYAYPHGAAPGGSACQAGGASTTGLAFYNQGNYPAQYQGALFFADYTVKCIWVMFKGSNGLPDPSTVQVFASNRQAVNLQIGPAGDLFYVDMNLGKIFRISYGSATNQPPTAIATAQPSSGPAPLVVQFDGSSSSDPEGGTLTYAWDLDGDGQFDDASTTSPTFTYESAGTVNVQLRVTDPGGATDVDSLIVQVGSGGGSSGVVGLSGAADTFVSAPDSGLWDVTGDLDLRVDVKLNSWSTPYAGFITKYEAGSGFDFVTNDTTRGLRFAWRDTAGRTTIRNSTVPVPFADGERGQLRVTADLVGQNQSIVTFFYRSDVTKSLGDDSGWVQLGSATTVSGSRPIAPNNLLVSVGGKATGAGRWGGGLYQVRVYAGIGAGSPLVSDLDFRDLDQLTSTAPDYSRWADTPGNPWTINGTGWTYTGPS